MNEKYIRAQAVLRREIPNLSTDAAARLLDALLDAAWDDHQERARAIIEENYARHGKKG